MKIHHALKRPEVVPWKDIVRFEAQPVHAPHMPVVVGATIVLVGTRSYPTPVKLSRSRRFDTGVYRGYDIILSDDESRGAITRLNRAIRPPWPTSR
ncbi:hypothetical protein AB0A74_01380 [Saccharothrix sp. NPDC042600]|uniref:hypothetical protein n=1 Tax=Saccharothrix TaxID=2071 RepID=UPI0033C1527E